MDVNNPVIETIDGEVFPTEQARTTSKRMFIGGFAFLPFLWGINVWLFWHEGIHRCGDPTIKRYWRWSAAGFTVVSSIMLAWFLFYAIAGDKYLSPNVYDALDASALDLTKWGFGIIDPNSMN